MSDLTILKWDSFEMLKLLFILTFDELFTFNCFSRMNSLMLRVRLRYFEVNILKSVQSCQRLYFQKNIIEKCLIL